jgi:hypothetical protein
LTHVTAADKVFDVLESAAIAADLARRILWTAHLADKAFIAADCVNRCTNSVAAESLFTASVTCSALVTNWDAYLDASSFAVADQTLRCADIEALTTRAVQARKRVAFVAAGTAVGVVGLRIDTTGGVVATARGANRTDGRRITRGAGGITRCWRAIVDEWAISWRIHAVTALTAGEGVLDRAGAVVQTGAVVITIATRCSVWNALVGIRAAILFDSTLRDARALTVARRAIAAIGARWR